MRWKNWPYWLKGAIIFLIFPIIGLSVLPNCGEIECLLWLPVAGAAMFVEGSDEPLFHIVNFIFYFIIGAFIGWIYGKIKKH